MVHFVRFDGARRKIPHEIGGSTTLRIGDHVYALTGVLVHKGPSATSGHYYCDVVCPPHEQTGLAYQCNDTEYPSLIEEELGPDYMAAYMHIYELDTGSEATPVVNTLESDTRKRKSGEKLTMTTASTTEKQQRRSGLQANLEEQGLPATSDEQQRGRGLQANSEKGNGTLIGNGRGSIATSSEQQRGRGLQANVEEQGLPATSEEQQRRGGLPASEEARNGKLIGNCRGSIPSTVENCSEEERRMLNEWVEDKEKILSIKTAERSKAEKRRLQWLQR